MFDDLEALFVENALTAYRAYETSIESNPFGKSQDIRVALNAATALYHFREHVPSAARKSRAALTAICPDYGLLGDIVNASKHAEVTHGTPHIRAATDITDEIVITEYEDAQGVYRVATKRVIVQLRDGTVRDVGEILRSVVNLWVDELHAMNLLLRTSAVPVPAASVPARSEPDMGARLDLEITQGLRANFRFRLQRYNPATGHAEPIDITGHEYRMTVREPPRYDLEFVATNPATGEQIRRTITLSADEKNALDGLSPEEWYARLASRLGLSGQPASVVRAAD